MGCSSSKPGESGASRPAVANTLLTQAEAQHPRKKQTVVRDDNVVVKQITMYSDDGSELLEDEENDLALAKRSKGRKSTPFVRMDDAAKNLVFVQDGAEIIEHEEADQGQSLTPLVQRKSGRKGTPWVKPGDATVRVVVNDDAIVVEQARPVNDAEDGSDTVPIKRNKQRKSTPWVAKGDSEKSSVTIVTDSDGEGENTDKFERKKARKGTPWVANVQAVMGEDNVSTDDEDEEEPVSSQRKAARKGTPWVASKPEHKVLIDDRTVSFQEIIMDSSEHLECEHVKRKSGRKPTPWASSGQTSPEEVDVEVVSQVREGIGMGWFFECCSADVAQVDDPELGFVCVGSTPN